MSPGSCCLRWCAPRRSLSSFPTRRSSDLVEPVGEGGPDRRVIDERGGDLHAGLLPHPSARGDLVRHDQAREGRAPLVGDAADRKSTRLNSSHTVSSYAVFCLKKKKNNTCR